MARTYNVIDADGHILEPVDLWDKYIDPAYRDRAPRLIVDTDGKERLLIEGKVLGSPKGLGVIGGDRRPAGDRVRRDHEVRRGPPGRLRSARAHPGHGPRRHRRRVPLSEPRPLLRRGPGSRARRGDVPRLQPLARRLLPALPRPALRCRHAADAVDRRSPSRRCASPARSSACAAASCARTPTTTACSTTRTTSRSGRRSRSSTSRSACTRARAAACRRSASTASTTRGARHIISHTMEMMLAAMSVIWGGVCDRYPEASASASSSRAAAGSRRGSTAWTGTSTTRASTTRA